MPPDVRGVCVLRNFGQGKFYVGRNFPKFNSIQNFFMSHARNITKLFFEIYDKNTETRTSAKYNII